MGKRSFEEAEGADVNGYEGQNENKNQNQHQHKPRNPHNRFNPKNIAKRQKTTQKINDGNLGQIKKRVRAIERLLEHKNEKLPANVRNDLQRELQAHKQRIYDESDKRLRSKMISKYHMVRFFGMLFPSSSHRKTCRISNPECYEQSARRRSASQSS